MLKYISNNGLSAKKTPTIKPIAQINRQPKNEKKPFLIALKTQNNAKMHKSAIPAILK